MDNIIIRIKVDRRLKDKHEFKNTFNACFNAYISKSGFEHLSGILNEEMKFISYKDKGYGLVEMRTNHFKTRKLSNKEINAIIACIKKVSEPLKVQFLERKVDAKGVVRDRLIRNYIHE